MIRVLNLYAGLGGNRKLWDNVSVTAVELQENIAEVYKRNNPQDTVIMADAHQYLLDNCNDFDLIWSSPPCQTHSAMVKATKHKNRRYPQLSLYEEIIFLTHFFKGKWVVENVKPYYKPLITPTLEIGRHLFWSNSTLHSFEGPRQPADFINATTVAKSEKLKEWLGIQYKGNIYYKGNHCPGQVLRNCVHPEIGKEIFNQLIA